MADPQLRSWYLDDGASAEQIGRRIGVSGSTARRRLLAAGVTLRTRREQIDFHDRLAGRRIPTSDELVTGYQTERNTIDELAHIHGLTPSRIRLLLIRYRIPIRPGGTRIELIEAERTRRRDQRPITQFIEMHRAGHSATAIALETGWDRKVVAADLHRAGIRFAALPPINEWIDRYITDGETGAEIAATYDVTAAAVYRAMKIAGIARRRPVVRHPSATDAAIVELIVDQQRSVAYTADRLGVSHYLIRQALRRNNIIPQPAPVVDAARLTELRDAGATHAQIAEQIGVTPGQVQREVRRLGLPRQQTTTELTIATDKLQRLVDAHVSDDQIAARYKVATHAVLRRRRQEHIRRPLPIPEPGLTQRELQRRLRSGATLSAIASEQHVGIGKVRRWCTVYGIERPAVDTHGVDGRDALDPALLESLYLDQRWSTAQIAAHCSVDPAIVTFALHSLRIPVRGPGNPDQPGTILLDELYQDRDVLDALRRHNIPARREGGWLHDRFPDAAPLTSGVAEDLYCNVGLSTNHISLLTGSTGTAIRNHLRRSGIELRPNSRSPWFTRVLAWHRLGA